MPFSIYILLLDNIGSLSLIRLNQMLAIKRQSPKWK